MLGTLWAAFVARSQILTVMMAARSPACSTTRRYILGGTVGLKYFVQAVAKTRATLYPVHHRVLQHVQGRLQLAS